MPLDSSPSPYKPLPSARVSRSQSHRRASPAPGCCRSRSQTRGSESSSNSHHPCPFRGPHLVVCRRPARDLSLGAAGRGGKQAGGGSTASKHWRSSQPAHPTTPTTPLRRPQCSRPSRKSSSWAWPSASPPYTPPPSAGGSRSPSSKYGGSALPCPHHQPSTKGTGRVEGKRRSRGKGRRKAKNERSTPNQKGEPKTTHLGSEGTTTQNKERRPREREKERATTQRGTAEGQDKWRTPKEGEHAERTGRAPAHPRAPGQCRTPWGARLTTLHRRKAPPPGGAQEPTTAGQRTKGRATAGTHAVLRGRLADGAPGW